MSRYYLRLLGQLPCILWKAIRQMSDLITIVVLGCLAVVTALNEPLGRWLGIQWQGVSPLFALVFVAVLVVLGLAKCNYQNVQELEQDRDKAIREKEKVLQERPEIWANPVVHNDRAVLEIHNDGAAADFTAKARDITTPSTAELYTMYWEGNPATTCRVNGGGDVGAVVVAEKKLGSVRLFKMGTNGEQTFNPSSFPCPLEITVTSTPTLKTTWGAHTYQLGIDEHGALSFSEVVLSVPHRSGSQN